MVIVEAISKGYFGNHFWSGGYFWRSLLEARLEAISGVRRKERRRKAHRAKERRQKERRREGTWT